jgi:hypothetical protein
MGHVVQSGPKMAEGQAPLIAAFFLASSHKSETIPLKEQGTGNA